MRTKLFTDTLFVCLLALPVFALKVFYCREMFLDAFTFNEVFTRLLAAPVCEEIIFRGVFLEYLLERGFWRKGAKALKHPMVSNLLVSLVFALLHYVTRGQAVSLGVFFPSLVLGWHYTRHRKIPPLVLTHFVYNLAVF